MPNGGFQIFAMTMPSTSLPHHSPETHGQTDIYVIHIIQNHISECHSRRQFPKQCKEDCAKRSLGFLFSANTSRTVICKFAQSTFSFKVLSVKMVFCTLVPTTTKKSISHHLSISTCFVDPMNGVTTRLGFSSTDCVADRH